MTAARSRLLARDLAGSAATGLRARPWRSFLTAAGIAIGVAAAVAVVGVSASSRARLLDELGREGNLLTVSAGQTIAGTPTPLPLRAEAMVARIGPVEATTATALVTGATVRRTAAIPSLASGGISVLAARTNLLSTLGGTVARGRFLNAANACYPAVVLGAVAARTLGIATVAPGTQVYVAGRYFAVIGILRPVPLAPQIDEAALVGFPVGERLLGLDGRATTIYLRSTPGQVAAVARVLPFTADPAVPEGVQTSRPSDLLRARATAGSSLTELLLGLAAVALLVAGVGVANIMVIAVFERRSEIGLRRALGATRRHVAAQFLAEALLLSLVGGLAGVGLGDGAVAAFALATEEPPVLRLDAAAGGIAVAVAVGILAALQPAIRAARLPPATALRAAG